MRAIYRSLAGHDHDAEITRIADGRADVAVDAGCRERVELTRIEVVPVLRPGTCILVGESDA